jgi:hypothetical protein
MLVSLRGEVVMGGEHRESVAPGIGERGEGFLGRVFQQG